MKKILFTTIGILNLSAAVPLAIVIWTALPAGWYPLSLIGLLTLPTVWIGLVSLRAAGIPVEAFVRKRPELTGVIVSILGLLGGAVGMTLSRMF